VRSTTLTYRTITNNKPDNTIRDNEKSMCVKIDAAISGDRNVIKKQAKTILRIINTLQKKHSACGM